MLENIRIVMVETQTPGNIGAAARAMKTMGLSKLVLVNPQEFPAQKAIWRSAGAVDVVENAQVVESLEDALVGCTLVIAASARQRRIPWPMLSPEESGVKACETAQSGQVAIVFGREDRGLVNEELQLCNYHAAIPANEIYPVLNVAAAVQVFCYEVRKGMQTLADRKLSGEKTSQDASSVKQEGENLTSARNTEQNASFASSVNTGMDIWDEEFAKHENIEHFYEHLEKVLVDIEFHDPENPRQLMTRMRRLFNRSRLDVMELNILRGVLTSIEKAINKK